VLSSVGVVSHAVFFGTILSVAPRYGMPGLPPSTTLERSRLARGIAVNAVGMAHSVIAVLLLKPLVLVLWLFSSVTWVWGWYPVRTWPDVSSLAWDSEPVAGVGENVLADLVVLGLASGLTGLDEVAVVFHDFGPHYECCQG